MDFIKLTSEILSLEEVTSVVTDPSCGAISLFLGTTRDNFQGKDVVELAYEAYQEMAEKEMRKLCVQAREKWALKHIALYHRLGLVPVTETSVIVAVSSEHRRESLDAVSFLIDNLKARVPIWKKEVYLDGSCDWKRNKECAWGSTEREKSAAVERDEIISSNKRPLEEESGNEFNPLAKKRRKEINVECDPEETGVRDGKSLLKGEGGRGQTTSSPQPLDRDDVDPDLIQIVASKEEINRRIAAFQQCKREQLDVLNVQEFCTLSSGAVSQNSCARTSAVVLRRKGSTSHLKLTRVVNDWGPQTLGMDPGSISVNMAKEGLKQEGSNSNSGSSREGSVEPGLHAFKETLIDGKCKDEVIDNSEEGKLSEGIEERLHNLESHLRILPGVAIPRDVYARLKAVEDRLLYLEGISPEYFKNNGILAPPGKLKSEKEIRAVEDDICLDELDMKIHELRMKLKQKQLKQEF